MLVSFSGGEPRTFRAVNFECEDVLSGVVPQCERVEATGFVGTKGSRLSRQYVRLKNLKNRLAAPAVEIGPGREIDLLIVNCMTIRDLERVPGLPEMLKHAKRSLCYITEVWAWYAARQSRGLLDRFDAIASGCANSVQPIAEATKRPTFYCPPALDAPLWCLQDPMPQRVIDIHLFGRKHMPWHDALLQLRHGNDIFYHFDTVHASNPISMNEHREQFRELNWRSKINIVNIAKVNASERRSEEEIGSRFFEAAAAGCAMVGHRPASPYWDELFGWEDSIFDVPLDEPDKLVSVVLSLLDDPLRLRDASIRNRAEFLRRHDAVYRWEQIFRELELEPTPLMLQRKNQLEEHASQLMQTASGPTQRNRAETQHQPVPNQVGTA